MGKRKSKAIVRRLNVEQSVRLGRIVSIYLRSLESYTLLDEIARNEKIVVTSYQQGGCALAATAISLALKRRRIGHSVHGVVCRGVYQHVVVKVGEMYLDADGAQSEGMVLETARRNGCTCPWIAGWDERQAGEIPCREVRKYARRLAARLGELMDAEPLLAVFPVY